MAIRFRSLVVGLVLSLLCFGTATAEPVRPPTNLLAPIESGSLHSYVQLQTHFSRFSAGSAELDVLYFAADAEWTLFDRLALGLTVPFITKAIFSFGPNTSDSTEFGNIQANIKAKIWGGARFSLSGYTNFTLPTATGVDDRDYAIIQPGLAATFALAYVTFGANTGTSIFVTGDDADDTDVIWEWGVYAGTNIVPFFDFILAIQWSKFVTNDTDVAASIQPTVRIKPVLGLFIDLSARIPFNDEGKLFFALGDAAFVGSVGWSFD